MTNYDVSDVHNLTRTIFCKGLKFKFAMIFGSSVINPVRNFSPILYIIRSKQLHYLYSQHIC